MKRHLAIGAIVAVSLAGAVSPVSAHEGYHAGAPSNQILYGPNKYDPHGLHSRAKCREGGKHQQRLYDATDGDVGYWHFQCRPKGTGYYWLYLWDD